MSILIGPLPEMRRASLAGVILQKPRRGTIPRRRRSSSGIGTLFTPDKCEPVCSVVLVDLAGPVSVPTDGASDPGEAANTAPSLAVGAKALRFRLPACRF